jgi:hypothetical protein
MADKLSKSNQHLDKDDIAEMFLYRKKSLVLFFSEQNPDFYNTFIGLTSKELREELAYHLSEIEKDACLNLLASIEAIFRLDYAIRCEEKDKAKISRKFRSLFADYQYRIPLEEEIFEEWKKVAGIKNSTIAFLKGAFKYRHWLAHGRYWTLKAGKKQYDFYELYKLATELDTFPFKRF